MRYSVPRLRRWSTPVLLVLAFLLLAGCSDEQMARMRGKLRGSIGRAGNPDAPQNMHARSDQKGPSSGSSTRGRLLADEESAEDDEPGAEAAKGRERHGRARGREELEEEEDLDEADLADSDEADFDSIDGDTKGKKGHHPGDGAAKGAPDGAVAPGSKSNPANPPQVQGPIKSCPEKGKVVGAPPPKGTGQWCEKVDAGGKPMRHGPYFKFHSNGQKAVQGTFVNGKANGLFVFWLPDGSKAEEKGYQNGQLSGVYVKYGKENQKVIEGRYFNGKKNGKFSYWGKAGRLKQEASFRENIKDGVWTTFNKDGQPRSRFTYKAGKKEGKAELFYSNGSVRSQGTFVDNEQHGQWTNYFAEGNLKSQGSYDTGEKTGPWTFYRRQGGIAKVVTYENGRAVRKEGYGKNGTRNRRGGRNRNAPPPQVEQPEEEGWRPL